MCDVRYCPHRAKVVILQMAKGKIVGMVMDVVVEVSMSPVVGVSSSVVVGSCMAEQVDMRTLGPVDIEIGAGTSARHTKREPANTVVFAFGDVSWLCSQEWW